MNENENLQPVEKLTPFTKMVMSIGTLPSSFYASMSYYESMVWLYEYLKNQVIPTVNNNAEAVEELQEKYIEFSSCVTEEVTDFKSYINGKVDELETYMNNYFTNLDVQQEINNKLDEMATDGTLTNLIKGYIDPLYQAYETEINGEISSFKTGINNQMTSLTSLVNSAVSGSPLVASSTSGMIDTTRVYVNTSDGYWYYYNGTAWVQGGVYQSAGLNESVFGINPDLTDGYIENNGSITVTTTNGEKTTDYINVISGGKINLQLSFSSSHEMWACVAYYKNSTYLSRDVIVNRVTGTSANETVTIPSNCTRIRFSFRTFSEEGCYTITDLSNYNFINNKLHHQKDRFSIISPGEYMTYDSINQTLVIKNQTLILTPNQNPQYYSVSGNQTLDLSNISSTAIVILYDPSTHEFTAQGYTEYIDFENKYIFATIRKQGSGFKQLVNITTSCPYTIDNEPINYASSKYPTAIIGGQGNIVLDTTFQTLTIPSDTIIINKAATSQQLYNFYIVNSSSTIDLSSTNITSSAINIWFDSIDHSFVAQGYSEPLENRYVLFCSIRRGYQGRPWTISGNFPYLIDGNKYDTINYDNPNVKMIAHRGLSQYAPENTIPAYQMARKYNFRYVETDVSFTSDGVAVLLHDNTIDRTSNGTGNINELTYAEVATYDFGSWKNSIFTGTRIPKFNDFITTCKRLGLHPYIELKSNGSYTQSQIEGLVDIVKNKGMINNVTWISFSQGYLTYVKNYNDKARIGYVVNSISSDVITTAQGLKTNNNEVFIDAGNIDNISLAKNANIPVEMWTVDSSETLLGLDDYVSGITTNYLNVDKTFYDAAI